LNRHVEINAPGFVELEKREPRERLRDAGNAKSSLVRYRDSVLEIRVPEILSDHRFAAEHNQGAQPDITLPSVDVGKRIPESLSVIATRRQLWGTLG
jgi:hypothetical protein